MDKDDYEGVYIKVKIIKWAQVQKVIEVLKVNGNALVIAKKKPLEKFLPIPGRTFRGRILKKIFRKHSPTVGKVYWLRLTPEGLLLFDHEEE